jgi:trehalose 6-phosphate phosphatase
LADIPGASVEHNTFCVSAHFRNCAADGWQRVAEVVESIVAGRPDVTVTRGRKVLEIRPQVCSGVGVFEGGACGCWVHVDL